MFVRMLCGSLGNGEWCAIGWRVITQLCVLAEYMDEMFMMKSNKTCNISDCLTVISLNITQNCNYNTVIFTVYNTLFNTSYTYAKSQ